MNEVEVVIVDYHREGNAARIAEACDRAFGLLGIALKIHILRPPEAKTPIEDFPVNSSFWDLDRNHGAQQRYSLAGEIRSEWSLYIDNDMIPTDEGIRKLVEAARTHGDSYSCYGWLGHNQENVRGAHLYARDEIGMEVDYILRTYLYRSQNVKTALMDFPIFHWEDDLNMQIKIQKRLSRPSWVVNHADNFIDLGGHDEFAHYRQDGHFDRRAEMVARERSYLNQS